MEDENSVANEEEEVRQLLERDGEVQGRQMDGGNAPDDPPNAKPWIWTTTLVLGPTMGVLFASGAISLDAEDSRASSMLGLLFWMAIWWASEALPLPITALLPVVIMPLLGVLSSQEVAKAYMNDTQMLFLGSFIVAAAVEKLDLHKRLAISVLLFTGTRPKYMMLGMLGITGFVSMWISNTATSILMVPLAVTTLEQILDSSGRLNNHSSTQSRIQTDGQLQGECQGQHAEKYTPNDTVAFELDMGEQDPSNDLHGSLNSDKLRKFAKGIVLCVAYGSTIGGLASLVGTGPNLVLAGYWEQHGHSAQGNINFASWIMFGLPFSIVFGASVWFYFCFVFCRGLEGSVISTDVLQTERVSLGKLTRAHISVIVVFASMVLLWVTRQPSLHGWGSLFRQETVGDGAVSVLASIVLFVLPAKEIMGPQKILGWEDCKSVPWDIILLMGGGFALSQGIIESGLFAWLSMKLSILEGMPIFLIPAIISLFVSTVTEFTSNVASKSATVKHVVGSLFSNYTDCLYFLRGSHSLHNICPCTGCSG